MYIRIFLGNVFNVRNLWIQLYYIFLYEQFPLSNLGAGSLNICCDKLFCCFPPSWYFYTIVELSLWLKSNYSIKRDNLWHPNRFHNFFPVLGILWGIPISLKQIFINLFENIIRRTCTTLRLSVLRSHLNLSNSHIYIHNLLQRYST